MGKITERTITHREHALAQKDAGFLKEVMGYLEDDGYYETGHAHTMIGDWLAELKKKADLTPTDDPLAKMLKDKHQLLTQTEKQKQELLKALILMKKAWEQIMPNIGNMVVQDYELVLTTAPVACTQAIKNAESIT